ncbi:MAG: hypothetical protein ACTSR8_08445 [Promethearchaeota archaeon]
MGRKDKKKQEKAKTEGQIKPEISQNLDKFEIMTQIDLLSSKANNYKMHSKFDEAIRISSQIVQLAMQGDFKSSIEEQDKFLKSIAKEVQKDHVISQIIEEGETLTKNYDALVESGNYLEAHELLQNIKTKFQETSYFETIPVIMELISKDNKNWIKYQSGTLK